MGRINCIAFRSGDNNTFYVGSPSGGLWKTTDGGSTWTVLTDNNDVLGVSDIILFAGTTTATDTLFIATGDRDCGALDNLPYGHTADDHTIGILKSVDGGSTWTATGLSFNASDRETTNRIIADPGNHQIMLAATSAGLYKTTDGGSTWTLKYSTYEMTDLEFIPGHSDTIIGGCRNSGRIMRSTDKGENWAEIVNASDGGRVEIAVSESNPNRVYAVIANYNGSLRGVWRSEDAGSTFNVVYDISVTASYQNLLHKDCSPGSSNGGQGLYDLSIVCDPDDGDIVYIGGINTWKSTDAAVSFSIINHRNSTCGGTVETVHADKHMLAFQPVTHTLFECNDGGIFKSDNDGAHWTELSSGLVISQMYRLAVSPSVADEVLCGLQDNGTKSYSSGTWTHVTGADGMECAIYADDNNRQLATWQQGGMYYTSNHWSTYSTKRSSNWGNEWLEPMMLDPGQHNRIYYAKKNYLEYSYVGSSTTWYPMYLHPTPDGNILSMDISEQDADYIYVASEDSIYRTNEGYGSHVNITNITGNLPTATSHITDICVSKADTNHIWVALGNYNGDCVYETTDGGNTWTNISSGLPQIPVMSVVENWQNTNETELYAGTDVGVYQKVGTADWTLYSTNLPNVIVTDLAIYFDTVNPANSRLRAATYGRGAWETELPPAPPVCAFTASNTSPLVNNDVVTLTDQSSGSPTYRFWSITPSTFSFQNGTDEYSAAPQVLFSDTGYYSVSLYVENSVGNDTEEKSNYIHVTPISYCSADGGSNNIWEEYITDVIMGDINNTGTGQDEYTDYTNLSTGVLPGETVDISINLYYYGSGDDIGVWIDWNRDGDFDDADENVVCETSVPGANNTFSFTVPSSATVGKTRMRVRLKYYNSNCGSPCGHTSYGEVEDYSVNVVPPTLTWTGNTSDDWSVAGNWSDNTVPDKDYSVSIPASPAGGNFPVIYSGTTASCYDLTIASGANLQIYGNLTVYDTLGNNATAADLVIHSTSSGTGSLITSSDDVNMTVQRYITDNMWHLISAPNSGATANALFFNHSPEVWLTEYHENDDSWNFLTALSTPMPVGKGFGMWIENTPRSDEVISFSGPVDGSSLTLNGSTTPSLSYHSGFGYNLIANPYPAALDWDKSDWSYTNLDGSIWVWDPGAGSYKTRNRHGAGSLSDGEIPPVQGFFVHATADAASITIPAGAKVHSSNSFYKTGQENPELTDYLTFEVTSGDKKDAAWLIFNNSCSNDADEGWDIEKMPGSDEAPLLGFKQNNTLFDVMAVPPPQNETEDFLLTLRGGVALEHNLKLTALKGFDDWNIYFSDRKTGSFFDLKKTSTYRFTSTQYANPERFVLHFERNHNSITQTDNYRPLSIYAIDNKLIVERYDELKPEKMLLRVFNTTGQNIFEKELPPGERDEIKLNIPNQMILVTLTSRGHIYTQKVYID